jgi:hypothetical protein
MHRRHAKANGKSYFYYACSKWHFSGLEQPPCRERYIVKDYLESLVWNYFDKLLRDEEALVEALREAQELEQAAQEPRLGELKMVGTLIEECEAEATALAEALKKSSSRLVTKALEDKMTQLDERYERLEIRRQTLEADLQTKVTNEVIEGALSFAQTVRLGLDNVACEEKRGILDALDARVTVRDGRVFLEYVVSSLSIELPQSRAA